MNPAKTSHAHQDSDRQPAVSAEGDSWIASQIHAGAIVIILIAVFLVLFTAWMLLGWMVGESRDIRWMRNWCAGIFVVMAILLCLGGGAWISRKMTQTAYRSSIQKFSRLLNERAGEGRMEDVRDAIQHLAEEPDEWSTHNADILRRIEEVTEALEKTSHRRVADKPRNLK